MKVIEISSKDEFIKTLMDNIDNENHVFSYPKKKYRGLIKFSQFDLKENQTSNYRATFYRITGEIEANKIRLNIQLHWNTYLLIAFQLFWYLFFIFLPSEEEREIALIFISVGSISTGFWIYRMIRRKTQLIEDFIKMAK